MIGQSITCFNWVGQKTKNILLFVSYLCHPMMFLFMDGQFHGHYGTTMTTDKDVLKTRCLKFLFLH